MADGAQMHPYHLVDPSPWPALGAVGAFLLAFGAALGMHPDMLGPHVEAFEPIVVKAGSQVDRDASGDTGEDTSGPNTDDAMTRSEEELSVCTRSKQGGKARELVLRRPLVQFHRVKARLDAAAVIVRTQRFAANADDAAVGGQCAVAEGLKQRGHQFAPGQIAGATKKNEVETHESNVWSKGLK